MRHRRLFIALQREPLQRPTLLLVMKVTGHSSVSGTIDWDCVMLSLMLGPLTVQFGHVRRRCTLLSRHELLTTAQDAEGDAGDHAECRATVLAEPH